jgi:hypothetical protein
MPAGSSKTFGRYSLTRPPRDNDELYELIKALWGVVVPRTKVCPEHDAPFDWFSDSFFARQPQTIALGSRGLSGKSYAMAVLGLTEAVVLGADVNIVGGSESQSRNLYEHMRADWEYEAAPDYMIKDNHTQMTVLTNRARIRPLTASQKTVRGPHPPRLLVDEVDEVDYPILQAAFGQPMPKRNWIGVTLPAQTAMTSTWQYPDGTMMKELKRFDEAGMKTHTWCYRESMNPVDGWLSPEFVEQKKLEIPRAMWETEYELQEPSIGSRAFMPDAVERTFSMGAVTADQSIKVVRDFEEYHFADYIRDHNYVIAADWARSQDYTVIGVWDVTDTPIRLVHYVRVNRRPWPMMIGIYNRLLQDYSAEGIHDATGLGDVVGGYIEGQVWNFKMVGRERDDMLTEYVSAVENDMIRAPRVETFYRAMKYCSVDDMYRKGNEFHLPDEVCSGALAWKACSNNYPNVTPMGFPKQESTWIDRQFQHNTEHLASKSSFRIEGDVERKSDDLTAHEWSLT